MLFEDPRPTPEPSLHSGMAAPARTSTADRLRFEISSSHYARQIHLDEDVWAMAELGKSCIDYLQLATGQRLAVTQAPRAFLQMLRPSRIPVERSYVMGIFRKDTNGSRAADRLRGVLYFLHPPTGSPTWYITLLLLEPAARGRGLGTAVHDAFARWATERGARRAVVAVAENNPRARRFWQERMGYSVVPGMAKSARRCGSSNQDFERHLTPAPVRAC